MNFYGHKGLDKFLYEKYFLGKNDGVAIEAGALDGVYLSSCKTFEEIGWKCINIEPNPKEFEKLVKNRPQSINLNVGLSDEDGTSVFEVGKRAKNAHLIGDHGVLSYLQKACIKNAHHRGGTCKFTVKTMTYRTLVDSLGIDKIDLFVLDVEGWEVQVIKGMLDCNILPDVLCVESCPSILKVINYEKLIAEVFQNKYRKDSSCWLNDVYVRGHI